MKKVISVLLCAVLALGVIPFSTYAEEAEAGTINVDMVWDELSFVYAPEYPGEWDIVSHTYKNVPINGWKVSDDMNNITVTNNSAEAKINVAFSFTPVNESEVGIDFYNSTDTEMTQALESVDLVPGGTQTVKVIPTGVLSASSSSAVKIGSISVTFSVVNS